VGNLRKDGSTDSSSLSLAVSKNREPGQVQCLRRGCENHYKPRRWNQRFCGDPDCRREVRRWQAAKRQQRVRQTELGRQRHREREFQRRRAYRDRKSELSLPVQQPVQPPEPLPPGAWSRCKPHPKYFCDRPGCYDPVRSARSHAARYCSDECRRAVERVRDRQRKHLKRQDLTNAWLGSTPGDRLVAIHSGRLPRAQLDGPRAIRHRQPTGVRNYGATDLSGISSEVFPRRQVDDQQRNSGSKSRAPPSSE
jgi:hypothetical protein